MGLIAEFQAALQLRRFIEQEQNMNFQQILQQIKSHANLAGFGMILSTATTICAAVMGASNPAVIALGACAALVHVAGMVSHGSLNASVVASVTAAAAQAATDQLGKVAAQPAPAPAPAAPAPAPAAPSPAPQA